MSKRTERWPIWKIAITALGSAVVAGALFWLSSVLTPPETQTQDESGSQALMTVPAFLLMMATAVSMLAVLAIGWLAYRLYDARIPAWQKKGRRKRRRRW
jgi:peptidoglycan/LPS O-acetylase OafA/YrhL